ncbi:MAG: hypothetical protein HZA78_11245 [Candidatus Schekmanbacteria bacterium]|nr:hypothetical protein [Candidatus Schekmanbacteria bacterium]
MGQLDLESVEYWKKILRETPLSIYTKSLDNLKEAFFLEDRHIRCIDEGHVGGIRLAGVGILCQDRLEEVLTGKVDGIYTHEECGAAVLYAKQNAFDLKKAEGYVIAWAQKLAKKLNVPYKGHTPIAEMNRPAGLHIAQVVYYDGTGQFDPYRIKELPPGFVISRYLLGSEYAKNELSISINIALGRSGLRDLFTINTPFNIVPVGHPDIPALSLAVLTEEAKLIAKQFKGRVAVNGFIAPA